MVSDLSGLPGLLRMLCLVTNRDGLAVPGSSQSCPGDFRYPGNKIHTNLADQRGQRRVILFLGQKPLAGAPNAGLGQRLRADYEGASNPCCLPRAELVTVARKKKS